MTYLRIVTIVFFPLLCACGCGQDKPQRLIDIDPPPDYSAIDEHASWSEAHDLIAYMHNHQEDLNDPDSSGIYVINPDGTEKTLFLSVGLVFGIDWSPDGQWIVANAGSELWKISYPEGVVETLLTHGQYYYPTWSPDGTRIASAVRAGSENGIHVVDADGENYRLTIAQSIAADWPHIDSLLFVNFDYALPIGSLCMSDSGGRARRVVYDPEGLFTPNMFPRMHAETGRIVLDAQKPGDLRAAWTLEPDEITPTMLFHRAEYLSFSPDGSQIVFTRYGSPYANLWIINWDGTGLRELTESLYD